MQAVELWQRIEAQPTPVILDLWAPWCLRCLKMMPDIERLRQEYSGQVEVIKLNIDENPDLARELNVWAIPTLIVYRNGGESFRHTGAQGGPALEDFFAVAIQGGEGYRPKIGRTDRALRLVAGLGLGAIALATGPTWFLLPVAGLVVFSAVYDRCPLWQLLAPRLKQLLPHT